MFAVFCQVTNRWAVSRNSCQQKNHQDSQMQQHEVYKKNFKCQKFRRSLSGPKRMKLMNSLYHDVLHLIKICANLSSKFAHSTHTSWHIFPKVKIARHITKLANLQIAANHKHVLWTRISIGRHDPIVFCLFVEPNGLCATVTLRFKIPRSQR